MTVPTVNSCVMYQNEVVVLDRGDYTTCAVNLYGAVVTSWRIRNEEHIFLSRQSKLHYLYHDMGGMSLAFPTYFIFKFGMMHGFIRDLKWTLEIPPKRKENGDVYAEFSRKDDEYTNSLWAYKFKVVFRITLKEMELEMNFTVENTCPHFPMEFEFVQQCMFKVRDVAKCKVIGLKDCIVLDRLDKNKKTKTTVKEDRDEVGIEGNVDKIFKDAPDIIYVTNGEDEEVIKITKTNMLDFNLWNPWIEEAKSLEDLGDDEFKYFLSTDCGAIATKISLSPKCSWSSKINYEVLEPEEKQIAVGHFYDYFAKYC